MKTVLMSGKGVRLMIFILNVQLVLTHDLTADGGSIQLEPNRGKRIVLEPFVAELQLQFNKSEKSWRFVIFQGHSQKENISLSLDAKFSYGSTDTGSNVAALFPLPIPRLVYPLFLNAYNSSKDVNVDVIAVPYKNGAPFPGACCLTCSMEFDPNIVISYTAAETTVTFSFANVYYQRNGSQEGPPCDARGKPQHYRLKYHIYHMFLKEGDLSEDGFFEGLEIMAYPEVIKTNGKKLTTVQAPTLPVVKFDTQSAGQGVVFNVIVSDPRTNMEAAYSPVVTYSCNLNSKVDGCQLQTADAAVYGTFSVLGSLLSLVLCFFGFRLFQFTLFVGGLVNFGFLFFIIITANSDISYIGRMLSSAGIGVIFGLLVFMLWWFTQWTRLCLLIDALFLGFLVGATLFFTPFGSLDLFGTSGFDYGAVLSCCTIVVPVVLILWPKVLCIAYTSIVSGYGFVVGIDFFLHTSISYIVVDVLVRATEPQYRSDHIYVSRPFQRNDYYLCGTWLIMAVLGCVVQYVLTKDRPHFPRSGFVEQKKIRKYLTNQKIDERTPLLINSPHDGSGPNTIC